MLQFDTSEEGKLQQLHSAEVEELAQLLATKYNLPYIDLSKFAINTDALRLIPEAEARAAQLAAFKISGRNLYLVLAAPNNPKAQAILEDLRNKNLVLQLYLGSMASLARAWERYPEISKSAKTKAGVIDISNEEIASFLSQLKDLGSLAPLFAQESKIALEEGGISSLLEIILAGGLSVNASDIHIEPQEHRVRMRYRLDGVLHDITFFEAKLYQRLLARVKLVSGLKLNVRQSAQDGRFTITLPEAEIEIRTSVLPGAYGESLVLRLLNPQTIQLKLEELGMEPELLAVVQREIAKPNGLVLLTGPTGSGKTTTLYAFLRQVSSAENKIITIEDPIEYHLAGVNQTQVDRGKNYTFLTGLRSALRQDPDIIMIGEIRDSETAKIAINASLTGHLVFSTLHTNNAAGTIPRLIDLEVNPKVMDAAINIAMAQRLVRRLCLACRVQAEPKAEETRLVKAVLDSVKKKRPASRLPEVITLWRAVEGGCDQCNHTGYRGRIGVFEGILMDTKVARLLTTNPSELEIKVAAAGQGILDMRQDGVMKVLAGITDLAELGRVVDLTEEIL